MNPTIMTTSCLITMHTNKTCLWQAQSDVLMGTYCCHHSSQQSQKHKRVSHDAEFPFVLIRNLAVTLWCVSTLHIEHSNIHTTKYQSNVWLPGQPAKAETQHRCQESTFTLRQDNELRSLTNVRLCILAESTSITVIHRAESGSNVSLDLQMAFRINEHLHSDNIVFHTRSPSNGTKPRNWLSW